ncbi:MAG: class I SAM-dependent methyltransferase [Solirubrobacterales bacterium]|nr:class I SAM-dependent methyltransferase [Solirubrobacterales bacterium]
MRPHRGPHHRGNVPGSESAMGAATHFPAAEAIWQDVEFGSYTADLPLWKELAAEAAGKVVELGAGSGRVGRALAQDGHEVVALEREAELAAEIEGRAGDLPLTAVEGDATQIGELAEAAGAALVIGPLQVAQLLDADERARMLSGISRCLTPGGRCALALVDESTLVERGSLGGEPRPDMREVEGWVYSSEPLWVQLSDDVLRVRRLRERVSPDGDLVRRVHDDVLNRLAPEALEGEAARAGLSAAGRRDIPADEFEAGSIVVVLEAR